MPPSPYTLSFCISSVSQLSFSIQSQTRLCLCEKLHCHWNFKLLNSFYNLHIWLHHVTCYNKSLYKITIPLRPAIHSLAGVHQNTLPTLLFSFGLLIYNPFDKAINFISPFYQAHLGNAACTSKLQRHDFSFIAEQMNAGNEKSESARHLPSALGLRGHLKLPTILSP